jgi:hypothetical protein
MDRVLTETTTMPTVPDRLPAPVQEELETALRALSRGRGLVVRLADLMGMAVGSAGGFAARTAIRALGGKRGAPGVPDKLRGLAEVALARAFDVAVVGLEQGVAVPGRRSAEAAVTLSGAVGGFYGMAGMVPDAAFTTLAIMREIARIARAEGEDLATEAGRRACLEVFLLTPEARLAESGGESDLSYFSARLLLQGRPVMALLGQAATRYGLVLSDKVALQAVPVVGAVCGAAVNRAFLLYYRDLAHAHFTLRRLERAYGETRVQAAAQRLI